MEDFFIPVHIDPSKTTTYTQYVYQWDYGLHLRITGVDIPNNTPVSFSNHDSCGDALCMVATTSDGVTTVKIPNRLLADQKSCFGDLKVYAWITLMDESGSKTIYKIIIPFYARSKPEYYTDPDNENPFEDAIEQVKQYADQASKSATNAKNSEVLAKKSADQAKESQNNADSSALRAEEAAGKAETFAGTAEEAAQSSQQNASDADAAALSAKESAVLAEKHLESVNTTKTEVEQIAKEVQSYSENASQSANGAAQSAEYAENAKTGAEKAYQDTVNLSTNVKTEIEQAGQEQVEAINQAGDSFLKKNQGTENAGKTLIVGEDGNVVPGKSGADLDALEKIAIKPTATGTDIIAEDSADWRLLDLSAQGWTEQNSTEGKNLLDYRSFETITQNGVTVKPNGDGSFTVSGTPTVTDGNVFTAYFISELVLQNGNYCTNCMASVFKKDGPNAYGNKFEFNSETDNSVSIYWQKNTSNYVDGETIFPMLNSGSDVLPWEPYTGGKPSPSPEYPQEIVNAGTYNEETQKYEVEVKFTGKNLWSRPQPEEWVASSVQGGYSDFKIYVGTNRKITFSFEKKPELGSGIYCGIVVEKNGAIKKWLIHSFSDNLNNQIATLESINDYVWIRCAKETIPIFLSSFPDFQIEYGEERTSFQEYKSQSVTITSDQPITKWDKLIKKNGVWGWEYNGICVDVLKENFVKSGNGIWGNVDDYETLGFYGYVNGSNGNVNLQLDLNNLRESACNYFVYGETYNTSNIAYRLGEYISFRVPRKLLPEWNEDSPSNQPFIDWMQSLSDSGNPLVIYCKTTNSEFVPLSESEQQLLDLLKTYYPTTVIQNDAGMEMTVKYVADPENYLRKNYQEKLEQVNALNARMTDLENLIVKEN